MNAGDLNNAVVDVTNKGILVGANVLSTTDGKAATHKLGNQLDIVADDLTDTAYVATNLSTEVSQDETTGKTTVKVGLAKDASFDSVTAGDTVVDNSGVTVVETDVDGKATGNVTTLTATGTEVNDGANTATYGANGLEVVGANGKTVTVASDKIDAGGNTINNVADAVNGKDAVNKDQLDALAAAGTATTDKLGESVANNLGGGSIYDAKTGEVTAPTYTVNGNDVKNVGDAITALDAGWNLNSNGTAEGAIKAGDSVDIGTTDGETNILVSKNGNVVDFELNKDLTGMNSISTVDAAGNSSVLNAAGTTVTNAAGDTAKYGANSLEVLGTNGKTVTIASDKVDVGGNTINNVADAVNGKDAVNKDQVEKFIDEASQGITTKGFALTAEDGQTINKKLGESVEVVGDENNLTTEVKEGKLAIKLADDLNVNSITAGDSVLNTAGLTVGNTSVTSGGVYIIGGPSVTTDGINAGNKTITNVADAQNATDAINKGQLDSAINGIDSKVNEVANNAVQYDTESKDKVTLAGANGTTLTNVKEGQVSQGSKDAVNGGQLWNVQQQVDRNTNDITNIQTDIQNINNGKSGLVQQENSTAQITVGKDTGGTSVNIKGTDGDRVLTGVAAGTVNATSSDAVNGSQLNTTNQAVVEYLGGGAAYDNITGSFNAPSYTVGDKAHTNVGSAVEALNQADQALNSKIDNVSNNLEQAFKVTNQRINDVEKRANAGIAAAIAFEAAPYVPGKLTYSAGAAYHGGENAVGVTLRKTADNGRWSLTGGIAAASEGDPSVRIGISGVID